MKQAADLSAFPGNKGRIGLIAGRGDLPGLLIEAAREQHFDIFVLAIHGDTRPEPLQNVLHHWLDMADITSSLEILREKEVRHVVMAGGLSRPPLKALRPSPLTTKLIGRLGKAFFGGDDALFKAIVRIFEEEGFAILGAGDLLKNLVTPAGVLTVTPPSPEAQEDIARGIGLAREIGRRDTGQAIIVRNGEVVGAETEAGTDELIKRCGAALPSADYRGILIKTRKPGQENRVDLPSAGPETIRNLRQAGFAGLALEAEGSLMIRKTEMITLANESGIFIQGFHAA